MVYYLSPGLHHALADGRNIFLDLKRDRYFALDDLRDQTFTRWCRGDPLSTHDHVVLSRLIECGLLQRDAQISARKIDLPAGRFSALDNIDRDTVNMLLVGRAALRILAAKRGHRNSPLSKSLLKVGGYAVSEKSTVDHADMQRHARAFHRASILTRTRDQCVPCSVALAIFLRRRAIPARLVVGVSARPFAAHCWVQVDDIVVNDMTDHVASFVPILVQ